MKNNMTSKNRLALCLTRYSFNIRKGLDYVDIAIPTIGKNDVQVQIVASGLNPIDYKMVYGMALPIFSPKRPFPIAYDFSGIIIGKGDNVVKFNPGDRIYGKVPWHQIGTITCTTSVNEQMIGLATKTISLIDAAAMPLVACTAMEAFEYVKPQLGAKVLIIGGSGGLGTFLIQYAKFKGCKVTATASPKNVDFVKTLSPDEIVDYTNKLVMNRLRNFDVVFDTVGGSYPWRSVSWVKRGGKIITLAGHHDQETLKQIDFSKLLRIAFYIKGIPLMARMNKRSIKYKHVWSTPHADRLNQFTELIDDGIIEPVIDRIYPFEKAIDALEYLETKRARGKVIVQILELKDAYE